MTASGRTPTLLLDSLAAEIGCDAVLPLPCLAEILPESVQLRYAQSGTCIHGRLQLAIYKQLLETSNCLREAGVGWSNTLAPSVRRRKRGVGTIDNFNHSCWPPTLESAHVRHPGPKARQLGHLEI